MTIASLFGMSNRRRRYSGHDRHFGPFTYSRHNDQDWRPLGVMLDSGGDHESSGNKGCNLKLHGFGRTLIVELPRLLPDYRIKHVAESWDAATVARMGRNYYFEVFPREYGFTISGGTVHVHYGPQTHDSITTRNKVLWIPWRQLRHERFSLYGLAGEQVWTQRDRADMRGMEQFEAQRRAEAVCPKAVFQFVDYDGKNILATTHIQEREWRHGTGWFRWLSLFRKPKISRSLDIRFSEEVGPEKGSWKGGTLGHGIEMLPGELHEAAFRRYCEEEHRSKSGRFRITFVGQVA